MNADGETMDAMLDFFARLPDARTGNRLSHALNEIVTLTLVAFLAGAKGPVGVVRFAQEREEWLRRFFVFPGGLPSHDTIGRVWGALDPHAFAERFRLFASNLAAAFAGADVEKTVSIDGKCSRGADPTGRLLDTVGAWCHGTGLVLAQLAVEDKSNESAAIPLLLDLLHVKGVLFTIDAAGTTRPIAEKILAGKGDYVLAVKDNQPNLLEEVSCRMSARLTGPIPVRTTRAETLDKGHGRLETRRCAATDDVSSLRRRTGFPGIRSAAVIERIREVGGVVTTEQVFFVSSRRLTAEEFLRHVRGHWGIENKLHWVLDVSMGEDACQAKAAARNFAVLRHFAYDILKVDPKEDSISGKMQRAAWNPEYLESLLRRIPV